MPTVGGCTNLPESESRFRRSASVAVPPPFTEVACYQVVTLAAGGELPSPETGTFGLGEAFLRHARGFYCRNRGKFVVQYKIGIL